MAETSERGIQVMCFSMIHVKTESCANEAGPALKDHFLAKREGTLDEN